MLPLIQSFLGELSTKKWIVTLFAARSHMAMSLLLVINWRISGLVHLAFASFGSGSCVFHSDKLGIYEFYSPS